MTQHYKTLQQDMPENIFRAYDIRGVVDEGLTADSVYTIGLAIGSEAAAMGQHTIVVARDGRLSGPTLMQALQQGLLDSGRDVIDVGAVPTPVLYFATHQLKTLSGVMLTGSHNPANYNGLKIVLGGETLAEDHIQALYRRIQQQDFTNGSGQLSQQAIVDEYIARIVGDVKLKKKLHCVIDCGNGIPAAVAPQLFAELGCKVTPLFCEVDGTFPNHHPDPTVLENLQDLIAEVKAQDADIGIAFDGDGDRLGIVDPQGKVIYADRQLMLLAQDVLSRNAGAPIIYDVKCSRHLKTVIDEAGGKSIMSPTGHSLVKNKMQQEQALLAGEMSGHIFFKERWYGFDDGLYAAARLLEIISREDRDLGQIFSDLPDSVNTPELKIHIDEAKKFAFVDQFKAQAQFDQAELITLDGVRVEFADAWGLLRASNTTPCLVLRFEADTTAALNRIQDQFRQQLLAVDPTLQLPF